MQHTGAARDEELKRVFRAHVCLCAILGYRERGRGLLGGGGKLQEGDQGKCGNEGCYGDF